MLWFEPKTKYVYKLEIPGMRCEMCEAHIKDIIRKSASVKKVTANRHKNLATIYSNDHLDADVIKKAIEKTGYKVLSIEVEEH